VNSLRRVVRSGVHQALDLEEGHERGAVASIVDMGAVRAEENYRSSWLGEAASGGGGTRQLSSLCVRNGQSACCPRVLGLSLWGEGGCMDIRMRAWSEPVEGGDDPSQVRKAGKICGLAKSRSIVLGLWVPVKGKRV